MTRIGRIGRSESLAGYGSVKVYEVRNVKNYEKFVGLEILGG
jgi:hypothetical protein